ncbi:MAG TPA: hypothetical protein VIC04_04125, partial [Terriglobia bacterium]
MRLTYRFLCLILFLALPALAQPPSARLDERLPSGTQFYVYWRGFASIQETRAANSLLKVWDDPEFAPTRDAIFEEILGERKGSTGFAFSREVAFSLLENQAVFGVTSFATRSAAKAAEAPQREKPVAPERSFLIYDATGKLPMVQAALQLLPGKDGKLPSVTRSSFGRTTIETVTDSRSTVYRAFVGSYFVQSPDKPTLEQIVKQLDSPGPDALVRNADYQAARRVIGERTTLDIFFNLRPFAEELQQSLGKGLTGADAVAKSMKADQIRALVMGLRFEAPATRVKMAVLGDMSPGGLFDLAGP